MNKNQLIKRYYNAPAACKVLGAIINKPTVFKNYRLEPDDFIDPLHKVVFITVNNLVAQDIQEIGFAEIESYLASSDRISHKKIFDSEDNKEWLYTLIDEGNVVNFDYYYNILRKYSLLREYISNGNDISDVLDLEELDNKILQEQKDEFNKMSIEDIIKIMDSKNLNAKKRFSQASIAKSRKCGENAIELWQEMQSTPSYGLNLPSGYMNRVTNGITGNTLRIVSKDSGTGKSRGSMKEGIFLTAPYYWDYTKKDFIKNPNGANNSVLYIGTEMDIYRELEPIMWSCISGVPTNKIKHADSMTNEEKIRVEKSIEIAQKTNFFLIEESNYSFSFINQAIEEYKDKHDICAVYLDYLELTPAITQEYSKSMKGMTGVREDQILLEASTRFKTMAKDYDLDFTCLTQVSDNFRTLKFYDQRAIKGGHSVTNKADIGIVEFVPDKKQLELVEPVVRGIARGLNKIVMPNIGKVIYKNRSDEYKDVIVWGWQNLGNGEYYDICVTNKYYEPINMTKQFITVEEDNE